MTTGSGEFWTMGERIGNIGYTKGKVIYAVGDTHDGVTHKM